MNELSQDMELDPLPASQKKPGGSKGLSALALLLALIAVALGAWQWWQAQNATPEESEALVRLSRLESRLDDLDRAQGSLGSRVGSVEGVGDSLSELQLDIARLQSQSDEQRRETGTGLEQVASLTQANLDFQDRLAGVEAGVAALAIRGESPTETIELAQVDFLLRTANERLQLFRDGRTADQALLLADGQLEALDDPLYLPVRRAIAEARLSLDDMPEVDMIGLIAQLERLQNGIPRLSFEGQAAPAAAGDEALPEDAGWWERLKASLSGLVTVRRRVEDEALVNLEDKDYVRQGLWLQLESARLALMRNDETGWSESLGRTQAALDQYFDGNADTVRAMQESLSELKSVNLDLPLPDISAPWAQLNLLRMGRTDAPSGPATEPDVPVESPAQPAAAVPETVEETLPDEEGDA